MEKKINFDKNLDHASLKFEKVDLQEKKRLF